jgi:uncharacterized protein YbbK (DUF523 family)
MKLCSACLLGVNCKYDGTNNFNQKIVDLARKEILIPICPEQLGGLTTPRLPAEIKGERVINEAGQDVTENFKRGAQETLRLVQLLGIKEAIFKQRSPSCGAGQIYDGSFSRKVIPGDGVTSQLLKEAGITIITEEDL